MQRWGHRPSIDELVLTACGFCSRRRVKVFVECIEIFQSGGDRQWLFDAPGDGFQSFVAVAGDADDDRLVPGNFTNLDELLGYSHFGAPGRLGKYSLGLGQEMDTFKKFICGYAFSTI